MSTRKKTSGGLTAEDREKWAGILKAATDKSNRAKFASSFSYMIASQLRIKKGPGRVTNWGKYAIALRSALRRLEKSARETIIPVSNINFEAEYESAIMDGMSAFDFAGDYAGRYLNSGKYLALAFELFRAYAIAARRAPKDKAGLIETVKRLEKRLDSIEGKISPKRTWHPLKTKNDGIPQRALGWIRRRLEIEGKAKKINVSRLQHKLAEVWPTLYSDYEAPGHSTMRKWIEEEMESL